MITQSRMACLALRLSGRLAWLSQDSPHTANEKIGWRRRLRISNLTTGSAPSRTTTRVNPTMVQKIAVFALAAALSGPAANVATARRGGDGGGHGGGGGHMGGGIGSEFVAGSNGGFGGWPFRRVRA
jgi:hypothetical protein